MGQPLPGLPAVPVPAVGASVPSPAGVVVV